MSNDLILPANPFFRVDIDRLCLICNCKFEMDQIPHSVLNNLEHTQSQMNVYDAMESISNFKEIHFQKEPGKVCEFCYKNISSVIRFCEMCNKSASFLKSYIQYQVMNNISQSVITNPETYIDMKPMSTEVECVKILSTKSEVLNDCEKPDVQMLVWPELPQISTGGTLSSTAATPMFETEEKGITNIETCAEELCTKEKMLPDKVDEGVNTLNSTAAMFVKEDTIMQEIRNLSEEEIPITADKLIGIENHEEIIVNGARRVNCRICNRLYSKYYISQHLQIHYADERPFRCKKCGKCFALRKQLRQHMDRHLEEKGHECKVCGKKFQQAINLREHLVVHSDKRPFACEKCEKCFPSKNYLSRHMVTHVETERHQCKVCGQKFQQAINLREHLIVHSDKRHFTCEKCGKCFLSKKYIKQHMVSHLEEKRHECKVCGKKFKRRRHMTDHLIIHSDERPFACEKCEKCFPSQKYLKRHMISHLEQKRYECHLCGNRFTQSHSLRKHLSNHCKGKRS